jgi:hypothetical protein
MIQDELQVQTTKCDNCIIGTMIAFQYLSCICNIVAMVSGNDEIAMLANIIDLVADILWCTWVAAAAAAGAAAAAAAGAGAAAAGDWRRLVAQLQPACLPAPPTGCLQGLGRMPLPAKLLPS